MGAVGSYQVHSRAKKSHKMLWKATKTPTIKSHVALARSIKIVVLEADKIEIL